VPNTDLAHRASIRTGVVLEWITLLWNVVGVVVLFFAAWRARSVALAGFGVDSLVEIGASTVVLWELRDAAGNRRARGLRLIGIAFLALAVYLLVQSGVVLISQFHPHHSRLGIVWTGVTSVVMFTLASQKSRIGRILSNPVLSTEGRVTMVDGILASIVLVGLLLNANLGWWWADPAAGVVIFFYACKEGIEAIRHSRSV
jgi:divalent metal cation (Fe/Co/Zn/Cd) transporter